MEPETEYGRHKARVERHLLDNAPDALVVRLSKQVIGVRGETHCPLVQIAAQLERGEPYSAATDQLFNPTISLLHHIE